MNALIWLAVVVVLTAVAAPFVPGSLRPREYQPRHAAQSDQVATNVASLALTASAVATGPIRLAEGDFSREQLRQVLDGDTRVLAQIHPSRRVRRRARRLLG